MRFSGLSVLGFASVVLAQWDPTPGFNVLSKPSFDEVVPAGKPYDVEWAGTDEFPEAITIKLYGGKARNSLDLVSTIASGVDSAEGTYSWAVPADLGTAAVYGIRIESETNSTRFQWGNPFTIKSGKPSTSTTASGSASATETETKTKTTVTSTKASETKTSTQTKTTLTTTFSANSSTTAPPQTTVTTVIDEEEEETTTAASTTATSTSTSIPTGAGVRAVGGASSFALLGGVALAVLAF
ncbi:Ser-Thr-rich glycosyl-phosphatidyl-inositol-anchored membrane family-domain-containing protein [Apiosordaria backusii]|uniref:Ser-Thr-rich glycosyl-phosphatidyl-inositol-anchored membrane family-domain-containing protein n=1 Tax=Apiosordaria backusii TaxID=314023 RepID=A0AA40EYQ6_9PEZI|nr:Ser-Thr-rich glycosyl-phosphatidyl-inositol-anchored membrane family-domain-containing protein [Apiosordaria backusii]